jgi:hypothetical protein
MAAVDSSRTPVDIGSLGAEARLERAKRDEWTKQREVRFHQRMKELEDRRLEQARRLAEKVRRCAVVDLK